jgi:hypothetical protein
MEGISCIVAEIYSKSKRSKGLIVCYKKDFKVARSGIIPYNIDVISFY